MKKEDFYIYSNGTLFRRQNNLAFQSEEGVYEFPIHKVRSIRIYGNAKITTKLIKYLLNLGIDIYFFTRSGVYLGHTSSLHNRGIAQLQINQVKAYINNRLEIANKIVKGIINSMIYSIVSIKYDKESYLDIKKIKERITENNNIFQLRQIEAESWKIYYRYISHQLNNLKFEKRKYNPPEDEINALISFINSLLYGSINQIIRELGFNELISFLHEPTEKRASLVLDIADIFKPYILLRILRYADKNVYSKEDYSYKGQAVYLNDEGRKRITHFYIKIMNENKKQMWGMELNYSIRNYIKHHISLFRNAIDLSLGKEYCPFLEGKI